MFRSIVCSEIAKFCHVTVFFACYVLACYLLLPVKDHDRETGGLFANDTYSFNDAGDKVEIRRLIIHYSIAHSQQRAKRSGHLKTEIRLLAHYPNGAKTKRCVVGPRGVLQLPPWQ
jgi:hypothetical protein